MPGIDKRLSRYPQLYSRIGFAHPYRSLSAEELTFVLTRHWRRLGLTLDPEDFTDAAVAVASPALSRITTAVRTWRGRAADRSRSGTPWSTTAEQRVFPRRRPTAPPHRGPAAPHRGPQPRGPQSPALSRAADARPPRLPPPGRPPAG